MPGSGKVVCSRDPDILERARRSFLRRPWVARSGRAAPHRRPGARQLRGFLHLEQHRDTAETAAPSLLDQLEPAAEVAGKDRRRTPSERCADGTLVAWVDLERAEGEPLSGVCERASGRWQPLALGQASVESLQAVRGEARLRRRGPLALRSSLWRARRLSPPQARPLRALAVVCRRKEQRRAHGLARATALKLCRSLVSPLPPQIQPFEGRTKPVESGGRALVALVQLRPALPRRDAALQANPRASCRGTALTVPPRHAVPQPPRAAQWPARARPRRPCSGGG